MFKAVKNTNSKLENILKNHCPDLSYIPFPGLWFGLRTVTTDFHLAKFIFFYGNTLDQHQVYDIDRTDQILKHQKFSHNKKTVCYLHGYEESLSSDSVSTVISAYMERNDHNILLIDWSPLSDGNYVIDALANLKQLAPRLADAFVELITAGLVLQNLHVVGHSMGAHLAGLIGRAIVNKSKCLVKIPRISGLDPAFPFFYPPIYISGLCKTDAVRVDVIHTDAWLYGIPIQCGNLDFWPNGGSSLQPGCPKRNFEMLSQNDLCSHKRSWAFWAESVIHRNSFPAKRAGTWEEFKRGVNGNIIPMGLDCPEEAIEGNYYLQTNATPLYSRGLDGTTFFEEATL